MPVARTARSFRFIDSLLVEMMRTEASSRSISNPWRVRTDSVQLRKERPRRASCGHLAAAALAPCGRRGRLESPGTVKQPAEPPERGRIKRIASARMLFRRHPTEARCGGASECQIPQRFSTTSPSSSSNPQQFQQLPSNTKAPPCGGGAFYPCEELRSSHG